MGRRRGHSWCTPSIAAETGAWTFASRLRSLSAFKKPRGAATKSFRKQRSRCAKFKEIVRGFAAGLTKADKLRSREANVHAPVSAAMRPTNPKIAATAPQSHATNPRMHATNPRMHVANPRSHAAAPRSHAVNPRFLVENPRIQAVSPRFLIENPRIQAANPRIHATNPKLPVVNPRSHAKNPRNRAPAPSFTPPTPGFTSPASGFVSPTPGLTPRNPGTERQSQDSRRESQASRRQSWERNRQKPAFQPPSPGKHPKTLVFPAQRKWSGHFPSGLRSCPPSDTRHPAAKFDDLATGENSVRPIPQSLDTPQDSTKPKAVGVQASAASGPAQSVALLP